MWSRRPTGKASIRNLEVQPPASRRVPRTLVLAEAKQSEVTGLVRQELEARGALLDERTSARTVFEELKPPSGFERGGYVGVYQPMGETQAEVLLQLWARVPRAAFWGSVALQLLLVIVLLATSPPSAVWFLAGLGLWAWFGAVALLYYTTFRGSRELEDELAAALGARFQGAGLRVVGEEEQLEQRIRERLEGEVKEREVQARAAQEPREPRFGRGRTAAAEAEPEPPAKGRRFGARAKRR